MAEHQLNDFKSNIETDGTVKFSFTLEDKGPAVAWPHAEAPVVEANAKNGPFGQLLVEGVISKAVPVVEVAELNDTALGIAAAENAKNESAT